MPRGMQEYYQKNIKKLTNNEIMKAITIEISSGQGVSKVSSYLGTSQVVQVHQVRIIQHNLNEIIFLIQIGFGECNC